MDSGLPRSVSLGPPAAGPRWRLPEGRVRTGRSPNGHAIVIPMPNTNQSCRISFKLLSDPFTIFAELRNYALDLNQIPARHSMKVS
jgi:hypothetical protein